MIVMVAMGRNRRTKQNQYMRIEIEIKIDIDIQIENVAAKICFSTNNFHRGLVLQNLHLKNNILVFANICSSVVHVSRLKNKVVRNKRVNDWMNEWKTVQTIILFMFLYRCFLKKNCLLFALSNAKGAALSINSYHLSDDYFGTELHFWGNDGRKCACAVQLLSLWFNRLCLMPRS